MNKSTRRHARELIGNLYLIQEAYFHLNNLELMTSDFEKCLSDRFTSCHTTNYIKTYTLHHISKSDDQLTRLLFPFTNIAYYQTLNVGKI